MRNPTHPDPDIAAAAALLADVTRARMVEVLLDGEAIGAGELARLCGVAPSTASEHLKRLVDGGLALVDVVGRRRAYRLSGPDAAELVETLARFARRPSAHHAPAASAAAAIRSARTCYDHLAGALGVAVTERLVARRWLAPAANAFAVLDEGRWRSFGIDLASLPSGRRPLTRACLDWSERRPHLAGALGAALVAELLARAWIVRVRASRAVRLTARGRAGLRALVGPGAAWDEP